MYGGTVYMYVTHSLRVKNQHNLDFVATDDLENFRIYCNILDMEITIG